MSNKPTVPAGFWEKSDGSLVPETKVKEIDKLRDGLVREIIAKARTTSGEIAKFKSAAMADIAAFVSTSATQYDANIGGEKGNVTLHSFDGRYKIQRAMQAKITFGEQLQAAKALIDECMKDWTKDSNDNIKALINNAFQVDGQGQVSTSRVLGLRSISIKDKKWVQAMQAIADSMQTVSSKAYIRCYERDDKTGEYSPIGLDVAAL
jgi:Protein of unknown function (DUF3164)